MKLLDLLNGIQQLNKAVLTGNLDQQIAEDSIRQIQRDGADNPYFVIMNDPHLTPAQKDEHLEAYRNRDMWKDFIVNVLSYGVAGLIIAACLSMAEAVVDRNIPAMIINGSMGATLGLLGGVIIALFVERLYHALGGSDGQLTTKHQILARRSPTACWG